jgi:cbb3-type cytochrome oxidase subunit 3
MNVDMLIYTLGALGITLITAGFVVWAFKTKQIENNDYLRYLPLEEDEQQ